VHRVVAFGPGRLNLIGEHTDYNGGLALPFAIEQGVRVTARPHANHEILARAADHDEDDRFGLAVRPGDAGTGWRAFVRGTIGELQRAGFELKGAAIEITGDVPEGGGLSSSAALEVSLCLALLAVSEIAEPEDRVSLARLCSRVENDWVGARSGLMDQLASLLGEDGRALRIDFRSLEITPVPLSLGDWALVTVPSGERHSLAASGYNQRVEECRQACELLGVESLRDGRRDEAQRLPEPLNRRTLHVIDENERVEATIKALARDDLATVAELLNRSHESLRDQYDSSTEAVERAVERLRAGGALGARMIGGGFGGHVLGLFPPGTVLPVDSVQVAPSAGARLLS
jgi:galactokinase